MGYECAFALRTSLFYVKWWITDPEVVSRFVVQRQVPDCPDIPVVTQRQFPMVQLFML